MGDNTDFGLFWWGDLSRLTFEIQDATGLHQCHATGVLSEGTPACIMATWGPGGMVLRVNEQIVATNSYTGGVPAAGGRDWLVGARSPGGTVDHRWHGLIAHIQIYNRVLTATEIADLSPYGTAVTGDVAAISSRSPTLYVTGQAGLTDSSGNNRTVTQQDGIVQTGQPMARGNGIRLNGAHIRIDNPSTSSFFAVDSGATDVDVQCEFGAGMDCIVPALANDLVLMSMDNDEATHRHGWVIWAHADGSVELQVRQPWQPARMRSPLGQISAGVQFHIQFVLGRDGMMLYLNGRRLDDGIKNSLVWHGLDRRERNTQSRNTSHFRVGATGTSANSDIIVGHIFAFVRSGHANELLDADCQAIAGASGATHPHRVWSASSAVHVAPGTNVLQAAINARSTAPEGGGRVLLKAGTFTQSVDLELKPNVELVGKGSGTDPASNTIIQLTNNAQITTVRPSINTFSALTGDIGAADKTLTATGHGLAADDVLLVMGSNGFHQLYALGRIANPDEMQSELMPVERIVDANTFVIDRKPQFAYPAAAREGIGKISPHTDIGLRNLRIQRTFGGSSNSPMCIPQGVRRLRLSNVVMRELGTSTWPKCFTPTGCVDIWTDPEAPCTFHNDAIDDGNGTNHPYNAQPHCCRGVCFHNCTLYGGGWHAVDAVSDNIANATGWPGSFSSSKFLIGGHLCVVESIVTGGGTAGDPATSRSGTRNRLNCHGGVKHYRWFNITMPRGGGFGFGGGYGDLVDIQGENVGELPGLSFTYGAWRCYAHRCNHQGGHATAWFNAFAQKGAKATMRDCVFSNVTKNSTTAENKGGGHFRNNTVRNVTGPVPSSPANAFNGIAVAPPDPQT